MAKYRLPSCIVTTFCLLGAMNACSDGSEPTSEPSTQPGLEAPASAQNRIDGPALLLSQAQFVYETLPNGKKFRNRARRN